MGQEFDAYFYRRRKNQILTFTIVFFSGLMAYFWIENPANEVLVFGIALFCAALVSCLWCFYDGEERGMSIGIQWSVAIFLFFPIALPIYLFATRGAKVYQQFGGIILILFCIVIIAYSLFFLYEHNETVHRIWETIKPSPPSEDLRL